MPIRVLLLGEESVALTERIATLPAVFDLQVTGAHSTRDSAERALRTNDADVAIVSADMQGASGFELVASIAQSARPSAVIFLSAREEDAVRAFELQATDFVPLPLSDSRFQDAMIRARQQVLRAALLRTADELQRLLGEVVTVDELRDANTRVPIRGAVHASLAGVGASSASVAPWEASSANDTAKGGATRDHAWRTGRTSTVTAAPRIARENEETVLDLSAMPNASGVGPSSAEGRPLRVLVREGRRTRFVPLSEVDWFEADGNYIVVHAGVQTYRTRGTVSAIEAVLDPRQFVRIHRRMVVNMDRVREMSPLPGGDGLLMLGDGSTLRLSRTYRSRVR